ncbi:MAG TPA: HAD-IIA family hydrolase [Candidatus Limnocylindria bacterium]|nr:HAD-IIA family hydrolase [Candidatus Limnocylindria bacterium]
MSGLPARVRLVIFDLDGVVYRGRMPVPGARDLVGWLHERRVAVRFATNNSTVTRVGYVERLAGMGIPTSAEEIVTSTSATIEHLRRHAPDVRSVLGIGADGMRDELAGAGFSVVMASEMTAAQRPGAPMPGFDAVLVGLDPSLDYGRLAVAMAAVAGGAQLIATNADARYPTEAGFLPGAGATVAALAAATGVTPAVIGKPEPAMFTAILEASGIDAAGCVVVGDNPDADIVGARRAGCASILVLTGVTDGATAGSLSGERAPDAVAADPAEVRALLEDRLS